MVDAQPNVCLCGLTTFGAQSGQLLEFLDHTKEIGTEDDEDDNLTVITPYKTDIEYLSDQVLTPLLPPPFFGFAGRRERLCWSCRQLSCD